MILKADSIEELANKIKQHPENKGRMVPANLVEQVTRFNKFCDDKKDADFGRRPATLGKIEQVRSTPCRWLPVVRILRAAY